MDAQVLSPGVAMTSVPSSNSSSIPATSTFNPVSGSSNTFNTLSNPNGTNPPYTGTIHGTNVNSMVDTSSYPHSERQQQQYQQHQQQQSNYISNDGNHHHHHGPNGDHAMGKCWMFDVDING